MKKNQNSLIFVIALVTVSSIHCMEVGKDDGGEYCYRIPGVKSGGMYPDLAQLQAYERSMDKPSAQSNVTEEVLDHAPYYEGVMNFESIKNLFPIFNTSVNGYPLIYLDSGATAQMPQMVLDAIVEYYEAYKANAGRGLYAFAERTTQAFEDARVKVARFIGAQKKEIVFTSGATASINLVAHIWAQHHINAGDEIVITEVEHNANFIPWQQLAARKGAVLKRVPLNEYGVVDVEVLKTYLCEKTKLVAVTHQSNILGSVNDIASIVQAAHSVGAKVLVDAAQSVAHQKIDVSQIGCDFLAFSGHKLFGPTGVGVLFLSQNIFTECVLESFGGGMVLSVTPEHSEFKCLPYCLEPGTQPIAQVIGLGAAIDFMVKHINFDQVLEYETSLVQRLAKGLEQFPELTIISPIPAEGKHGNMVTFTCSTFHAYDIAEHLDKYGIAVRAGFHCVQPYHDKLGGNSSVRASFTIYNTPQEVDFFIECLKKLFEVA
jgi:cysteine desulfurase / selenocysteine lyase